MGDYEKAHTKILDQAWREMMDKCPPTYCPEKPKNLTRLLPVMATAKRLGVDLLPHQKCMVAAITEMANPRYPKGRLRYSENLIVMSRQSGKSATLLALSTERLLTQKRNRQLWAAQKIESAIHQIEQDTWHVFKTQELRTNTLSASKEQMVRLLNATVQVLLSS